MPSSPPVDEAGGLQVNSPVEVSVSAGAEGDLRGGGDDGEVRPARDGSELVTGSARVITEGAVGHTERGAGDEQAQVEDRRSEMDAVEGDCDRELERVDFEPRCVVVGADSATDGLEDVSNLGGVEAKIGESSNGRESMEKGVSCQEKRSPASVDGGFRSTAEQENMSNLQGVEAEIGESSKGGEFMEKIVSCPEKRSSDSVDGGVQSTAGQADASVADEKPDVDAVEAEGAAGTVDAAFGADVGDHRAEGGSCGDQNHGVGAEAGGLVETAEAAADSREHAQNVDAVRDEIEDVSSKVIEDGVSYVEEKKSMELDVTNCDIVDRCSQGAGGVASHMEPNIEDALGDDQNMAADVLVGRSIVETDEAPAAVSLQDTKGVFSEGVANLGGVQLEVRETRIETESMDEDASSLGKCQSEADDEIRCDLVHEHVQETEIVSGRSDTGQDQVEMVLEFASGSASGSERASSPEKRSPSIADGDAQATEGIMDEEVNDELAGDGKPEINKVEPGGVADTVDAADFVGVRVPQTDHKPWGDQQPEEGAEEAGGSVDTADAADGLTSTGTDCQGHVQNEDVAEVKIEGISSGSKFFEKGISCVEKNSSSPKLELKGDDGLGGDLKLETDVYVAGSLVETGKAPAALFLETSRTISSTGVLDLGAEHIEKRESNIQTELMKENAASPAKNQSNTQETATDVGLSDTDQSHARVVSEFNEGKGDVGYIPFMDICQESESQRTFGSTEVADASMSGTDQEGHHEAPILHSSVFGKSLDAQEVGCSFPRGDAEVSTPLDETVIAKAHDLVLNTIDENMIGEHDLKTAESNSLANEPFCESENRDAHAVNGDKKLIRDFEMTEVLSDKTSCEQLQKSDLKNVIPGNESVSIYPMVEEESRQTELATETPGDKKGVIVSDACLFMERQGANACPHGGSLAHKEDSLQADSYSFVGFNESKPSVLSELCSVVSKGDQCPASLHVETERAEVQPIPSSSDEGLVTSKTEVEAPVYLPEVMEGQSTSHISDEESNVLKADRFPQKVLCGQEAEVVQKLDGSAETPTQASDEVNFNGRVQAGEQERQRRTHKRAIKRDGTNSIVENDGCARYRLPPEDDDSFSFSNLVWGKVKSHPWWPGQIFDSAHASEMALNCQRKDGFLVAYFGDKTFAWCEEAQLKPLQKYFSQMERQSSSDSFTNAVNEVLAEVFRRLELGMACGCLPEKAYADIKYMKIDNAGILEGICGLFIDRFSIVNDFQPGSLLEFVQDLAQFPTGGADKLDLVIAQAHLKSFYRLKGYSELPNFLYCGGLVENDAENLPSSNNEPNKYAREQPTQVTGLISESRKKRGRKRKSIEEKPIEVDVRKQKSLSELIEEESIFDITNSSGNGSEFEVSGTSISHSSGKKRHSVDPDPADPGQSKRKRFNTLRDSEIKSTSSTPNGSFRVGEWIRRAASQLTGSTPVPNSCSEKSQKSVPKDDYIIEDNYGVDASLDSPEVTLEREGEKAEDYCSFDELLSQLCLAATDPLKAYSFVSTVVSFFTNFRNSCCKYKHAEKTPGKRGRPRKTECNLVSQPASSDTSTPDHMKDSYWSDVIFHDTAEKKLLTNGLKRKGECHMRRQKRRKKHEVEPADSLALGHVSDTARPFHFGGLGSNMKQERLAERPMIILEEKIVDESAPTELILNFNKPDSIPSETDLIRIFSRYGPLKEAETEVLTKANRAKVVFKKRADAEIAFSSAGKFSTFGPALLSYKLRYLPSTPKASQNIAPQDMKDSAPANDENMVVPAQAEYSESTAGDPAQAATRTEAMTEPAQTGIRTEAVTEPGIRDAAMAGPAEVGLMAVTDQAQIETRVVAMPAPAQPETSAVSDPAHAEGGMLAETYPAQPETGELVHQAQPETTAVSDPAEGGMLAEDDPAQAETRALVDPAQSVTTAVPDAAQAGSGMLPEAYLAQAVTGALVDPVKPETTAVSDPADCGMLAEAYPVQVETRELVHPAQPESIAVSDSAEAECGMLAEADPAHAETVALVDPAQPETTALSDTVQAESGMLAEADQAQPETTQVFDRAEVESGMLAEVDPAQAETGPLVDSAQPETISVPDPAEAEGGMLAEADAAQAETGELEHAQPETTAVSDPAESEGWMLEGAYPAQAETRTLVNPAQPETTVVPDPAQVGSGMLAEAYPAQAETRPLVDPAQPEPTKVSDPVQAGSGMLAEAYPAQAETRPLVDPAQPETTAVPEPAQAGSGMLAEAYPAQAESAALVDPAQARISMLAVACPAQTVSGAMGEADRVQAETCALGGADPENRAVEAAAYPAQTEIGELALGDLGIVSLADVDPAQTEIGAVMEAAQETCALAEADFAQEGTRKVEAPAQAESGEVAVADPEMEETAVAVMDPSQAESGTLAVSEPTQDEATS